MRFLGSIHATSWGAFLCLSFLSFKRGPVVVITVSGGVQRIK
jgi:hypothetical protein